MYNLKVPKIPCQFERTILEAGESIEEKIRRVTTTNEPIDNAAPMIYTEREDGVQPQYDIRTDRWDIAQEAMDKVTKSVIAKRTSNQEQEHETGKNQEPAPANV